MVRFTLTFRELLTAYSCVSTMAAVQGTDELEALASELNGVVQAVSDSNVVEIDVVLGRGDS